VLGRADTSPHTWKTPVEVDPSSLDDPYANYSAVGTSQLAYDGTCNPMPGWNPSFNPSSDIGCRVLLALRACRVAQSLRGHARVVGGWGGGLGADWGVDRTLAVRACFAPVWPALREHARVINRQLSPCHGQKTILAVATGQSNSQQHAMATVEPGRRPGR
jgi:hypothetical protein